MEINPYSSPSHQPGETASLCIAKVVAAMAVRVVLLLVPSVVYIAYVDTFHPGEMLWEIWYVPFFLGSCALNGTVCWSRFSIAGLRMAYQESTACVTEKILVRISLAFGSVAIIFGMYNFLQPVAVATLPALLALWILTLAVLVPIDAAGLFAKRSEVIVFSAITPWAFVIMYPVYVFSRPGRNRASGYFALASVVMLMGGWVLWLLGADRIGFLQ